MKDSSTATERVGRYQLLEPIGAGPNGVVARAKVFGVAGFERQFAVKRFSSELTAIPAIAQGLSAAARSYGSLEHPRIARMSEFGVAQGQTFTAVEFVAGLDAMRMVAEAKLAGQMIPAGGALALISQAARAVGYAHGRGLSHLGLAPTNVIVTADGDVKVTDFGILAATLPPEPALVPRLAGRVAYLAPEQLAGEATSAATDVFVLGVIAYELITGQPAFRGDTPRQVADKILAGPPVEPSLPRPIVRVLQRCLARSPFERFPDARAFADALDAALRVAPVPGTRKDVGAHVKATLERHAALNEGQLSGMLALHVGTAPRAGVEDAVATTQFVRPDVPVGGPAPLVGPASLGVIPSVRDTSPSATIPELPKPMTTVTGVAPPPIPVPPGVAPGAPPPAGSPGEAKTILGMTAMKKPIGVPSIPVRPAGSGSSPPVAPPPAAPSLTTTQPLGPRAFMASTPAAPPPTPAAPPPTPAAPPPRSAASSSPPYARPGSGDFGPEHDGPTPLPAVIEPSGLLEIEQPSGLIELDPEDSQVGTIPERPPSLPERPPASPPPRPPSLERPASLASVDPSASASVPRLPDPPPSASGRTQAPETRATSEMPSLVAEQLNRAAVMPTDEMAALAGDANALAASTRGAADREAELDAQEPRTVMVPSPASTMPGIAPAPARTRSQPSAAPPARPSAPETSGGGTTKAVIALLVIGAAGTAGYLGWQQLAKKQTASSAASAGSATAMPGDTGSATRAGSATRVAANDTHAGSAADTHAGSAVDTHAGSAADTHAGAADTHAGSAAGSAVATHAGSAADTHAGSAAGSAADTHAGSADPHAGSAAKPATDVAQVKPARASDALEIATEPAGARVFLDGADQGTAPVKVAGSGDHHTLALLLPGHDLYVGQLDGQGAYKIALKAVTPPGGPAGIKVIKCKDKQRYYVFVDNKPTGMTCPTERIDVITGAHTVEVYDAVTDTRRTWDIDIKDTRLSYRIRLE